jgi:hypothetical protein
MGLALCTGQILPICCYYNLDESEWQDITRHEDRGFHMYLLPETMS